MLEGTKEHCPITFFFFAPLDVRQPAVRILTKIGAVAACPLGLWHTYSAFKTSSFIVKKVRERAMSQPPTRRSTVQNSDTAATRYPDRKRALVQHLRGLGHQSTITAFFQLAIGTVAIALNEKTIRTNNFVFDDGGIVSSGQLIPFLVGIFSIIERLKCLISVAWLSARELRVLHAQDGPTVLVRFSSEPETKLADKSPNLTQRNNIDGVSELNV